MLALEPRCSLKVIGGVAVLAQLLKNKQDYKDVKYILFNNSHKNCIFTNYSTFVQTFHSFVIKIMAHYLPQYFFPLMHFAIQ